MTYAKNGLLWIPHESLSYHTVDTMGVNDNGKSKESFSMKFGKKELTQEPDIIDTLYGS
jgi:hypothetical protein